MLDLDLEMDIERKLGEHNLHLWYWFITMWRMSIIEPDELDMHTKIIVKKLMDENKL